MGYACFYPTLSVTTAIGIHLSFAVELDSFEDDVIDGLGEDFDWTVLVLIVESKDFEALFVFVTADQIVER